MLREHIYDASQAELYLYCGTISDTLLETCVSRKLGYNMEEMLSLSVAGLRISYEVFFHI